MCLEIVISHLQTKNNYIYLQLIETNNSSRWNPKK